MPKPYYLTEFIFHSSDHTPQHEATLFASEFLSNRLRALLKNGFEKQQSVERIEIPAKPCTDEDCQCEFVSYYYHFLITLDKKYKARMNADKAYILKLLHNKDFIADFQQGNQRANEAVLMTTNDEYPREKHVMDFHDLMSMYDVPLKYEFVIEGLFTKTPDQILGDLENFVISNTTYENYYNYLVYLDSYEDILSHEYSYSKIKTEYSERITKQDIKDSFGTINYFQTKYFADGQSKPKFAVDKYAELIKLDSEQSNLTDLEKADIIFKMNQDLATGKLPTAEEDKRKIALIRMMRNRYKKYLKQDQKTG